MKKILVLILFTGTIQLFAGGEISFKKQKEWTRKIEEAKLEAIKNSSQQIQNNEVKSTETAEKEETLELNTNSEKKKIIFQD